MLKLICILDHRSKDVTDIKLTSAMYNDQQVIDQDIYSYGNSRQVSCTFRINGVDVLFEGRIHHQEIEFGPVAFDDVDKQVLHISYSFGWNWTNCYH